jgi:hypothetical protein
MTTGLCLVVATVIDGGKHDMALEIIMAVDGERYSTWEVGCGCGGGG